MIKIVCDADIHTFSILIFVNILVGLTSEIQ